MADYRRNRVPAGTYFFTVNLLERKARVLVDEIEALRAAVRKVRAARSFHIDCWVVLPDHKHCMDIAAGLHRLPVPLESDQDHTFEIDAEDRAVVRRAHRQRRTGHQATTIMGTYDSRRLGLCPSCRLRSFQSRETWACHASE